jgi:hypothetical protein
MDLERVEGRDSGRVAAFRAYRCGMTAAAFQTAIESWHDFYLAVGSASAALLGLLFVGVSINLSTIAAAKRTDLRTRADLAFSNLLYLLCMSLIVLIPGTDAVSVALSFAALGSFGLLRIARRVVGLIRSGDRSWRKFATIRRLSWTVTADFVLLYVGAALAIRGDATSLYEATFVVFVLIVGAADISWDLLVLESEDDGPSRGQLAQRRVDQGPRRPDVADQGLRHSVAGGDELGVVVADEHHARRVGPDQDSERQFQRD